MLIGLVFVISLVMAIGGRIYLQKKKSEKGSPHDPKQTKPPSEKKTGSKEESTEPRNQVVPQKTQKAKRNDQSLRKIGKLFSVTSDTLQCPVCVQKLIPEDILLALFPSETDRSNMEYIRTSVVSCPSCKRCFVSPEHVNAIRSRSKGKFVDIVDAAILIARIELAATKTEPKPFRWPTTEVNVKQLPASHRVNFNLESELHQLGYKITGMTREKRWFILERKAVPKLGLKKVATIIAANVRNRKLMKNGAEKNAYAITEWEYDLQKLKRTFYDGQFEWPRT